MMQFVPLDNKQKFGKLGQLTFTEDELNMEEQNLGSLNSPLHDTVLPTQLELSKHQEQYCPEGAERQVEHLVL